MVDDDMRFVVRWRMDRMKMKRVVVGRGELVELMTKATDKVNEGQDKLGETVYQLANAVATNGIVVAGMSDCFDLACASSLKSPFSRASLEIGSDESIQALVSPALVYERTRVNWISKYNVE